MSHSVDIHAYRADDDEVLARLIEQVNDQMEAGESVDLKALTHEHPEHEARLRNLLPAIRTMVKLGDMPLDVSVPAPTAGGMESQIPADKRLGDYEILEEIGRGGMGVVYRARQLTLGRVVALKILPFAALADPRHLQRFHNEARAIATLHHPHIVPIHSYGVERGVHYYAMEYVEGATLAQVLEGLRSAEIPAERSTVAAAAGTTQHIRSRPDKPSSDNSTNRPGDGGRPSSIHEVISRHSLSVRDYSRTVARWGIEVAGALEHAHANGVVHRDVKPNNLLLDSRGHILITDFGLARMEGGATVTLTGDVFGTLRYMSPEQADGRFADPRTDVYSLGVTLYELLALRPPFQGERRQELLKQIAWQEPPRLRQLNPAIPRELETIVGKALAKEAGQRYATAKEMADDLRCFLENRPLQARPPTLIDRAVKWLRRHPGLTVATLVTSLLVMLTAGVSTAVVWRAKQEAESARARAEQKEAVAEQKRDEIRAVMDFLVKDVLGAARTDTGPAQQMTVLEVLEYSERKLDQALVDQPLLEARIRSALGKVYAEMRMHDAELQQHTRAYELTKQHAGLEDPETLTHEMDMATALCLKGKFAEAIEIYETILPIQRRVLPPGAGNILSNMTNLANALDEVGSFQAARKLREEALQWCRKHRTADHRDTTRAMADLALSLHVTGDVTAARDLLKETLQIQQSVFGPEDRLALMTLHRLANVQAKLGKLATARKLREQVLEVRERVLGPEHPDTLGAMFNLADSLNETGEVAAARELCERVVESSQRVLGPEHHETLKAMGNLANYHAEMGDIETARKLRERTYEDFQRVLGPDHPDTLTAMMNLANSLTDTGELAAARKLNEELVGARRRVLGPEHPETLSAMKNLGLVLLEMGEHTTARGIYEQLVEIRLRSLGPEHPETLEMMNTLGCCRHTLGETAAARELHEGVLEIRRRVQGPEHPDTLQSMHNLANCLDDTRGEDAAARELREQVLEIRRRILGPEHPATLTAMAQMANSLSDMEEHAAARELLARVVEIRRRVQGPEHPDTVRAIRALEESNDD